MPEISPPGADLLTKYVYDLVQARKRETLEHLLHEDFRLSGTRDQIGREEWLHCLLEETVFDSVDIDLIKSEQVAANAVISTARIKFHGWQRDEPLRGTWLVIDVWKRNGTDWQLISRTTFPSEN